MDQTASYHGGRYGGVLRAPMKYVGTTDPASVPFKAFAGDSLTETPYHLEAEACTTDGQAECIRITAKPTFADAEVDKLWATSSGAKNCSGTARTEPPAAPPKVCWP